MHYSTTYSYVRVSETQRSRTAAYTLAFDSQRRCLDLRQYQMMKRYILVTADALQRYYNFVVVF